MAAPARMVLVRPRTVLLVLGLTLAVAFAAGLVYVAWRAVTWILVAVLLALALNPAVSFAERRGLQRGLAAAGVFVVAVVGLGAVAFALVPPVVREINEFIEAAPGYVADLTAGRGPLGFLERDFQIVERVRKELSERTAAELLGLTAPALSVVRGLATMIFAIVAIGFLTFFMLLEGPRLVARFLELVPQESRPRWERVLAGIARSVSGWATGALLVAVSAGVASTIVLIALDVPFPFALGLLVAILDLIPLAGATLAGIILTAVALTQGLVPAIVVPVFFVLYQQLENHVLVPLVYGRTVQLSALTVLVAILIGAELAGIVGVLVAIPVAASIQVVVHEIRDWRRARAIPRPVSETGSSSRLPD